MKITTSPRRTTLHSGHYAAGVSLDHRKWPDPDPDPPVADNGDSGSANKIRRPTRRRPTTSRPARITQVLPDGSALLRLRERESDSMLSPRQTKARGHTPHLAEQEIHGLLTVYDALVGLAVAAAVILDIDPDEINFAAVLALTRNATNPRCTRCGHTRDSPTHNLTAITAQPRNSTTRQRTSPAPKHKDEPNEHAMSPTHLPSSR